MYKVSKSKTIRGLQTYGRHGNHLLPSLLFPPRRPRQVKTGRSQNEGMFSVCVMREKLRDDSDSTSCFLWAPPVSEVTSGSARFIVMVTESD